MCVCFCWPCPVPLLFCCWICGETQIWLGDLRVAVVFLFRFFCSAWICHIWVFWVLYTPIFTAYAIVMTEPCAFSATPEEKKTRAGSFLAACGYALHVFGFSDFAVVYNSRRLKGISDIMHSLKRPTRCRRKSLQ